LVVAGALSLVDAAKTVKARGRYMQEAVPVGTGAMAAVLGAELETIQRCCNEASQGQVCSPANMNSPGQVVIAGNTEAVDRAMELLKAAGAKRVIKLNVSAPFHCALMKPAQDRLAQDLAQLEFLKPTVPVVTNVDAELQQDPSALRDALVRQVSAPVRWLESMQLLLNNGVEEFVEVGPGKVLSGLMRQISRETRTMNVEDATSLTAVTSGAVA
jgi:[acyl-carrier-protein] S-malonyltransferase